MGLACSLLGHKYVDEVCVRCGAVCDHSRVVVVDPCHRTCRDCGREMLTHAWEPTGEPGWRKCAVCGETEFSQQAADEWEREQERKRVLEERQKEADANFEKFLQAHKRREKGKVIREGEFVCDRCAKVLPVADQYPFYGGVLCRECVRTLSNYNGHYIFERVDSRKKLTRTCVKCWECEWSDKDGQTGGNLANVPCFK